MTDVNSDPADRPTAEQLISYDFCYLYPNYNFLETELYNKIREPA